VGQPELRELLDAPELKQLNQRIAIRFHLEPLSLEETGRYIKHRLQVAGGGRAPVRFSTGACRMIHAYSQGVPRRINIACNAVLVAGCLDERRSFDGPYARRAIVELDSAARFEGADGGDDRFDEPEPRPELAEGERVEQAPAPSESEPPKPERRERKPRRLVRRIAIIGATAAAAAGAAYWWLYL